MLRLTRFAAFLLYLVVGGALLAMTMGVMPSGDSPVSGLSGVVAGLGAIVGFTLLSWLEDRGLGLVTPRAGQGPAPSRAARHAVVLILTLAVFGSMLHQAGPVFKWVGNELVEIKWRLWEWYIEDAAISFAFARNWAAGDGLVAFPGGERIEGYSNPAWVALMALWYLVGVDGFMSSKLMAMGLGGATVLMVWFAARDMIDDEDSAAPILAPIVLAIFPTFAFWNASGLENPLFTFFLCGGIWRTIAEAKRGGFPWAAVFFLGLAVTRPEAIMYGAWGGFVAMSASLLAGRGMKPTLAWLATFFIPFLTYHAIRYQYFAHTFPNTYYAKLGSREFRPFAWMARGWKYIRKWGYDTNIGWFVPIFLTGLVGLRGARRWWILVGTALIAVAFLYPNAEITAEWDWWPTDLPSPTWWVEARVWILFGTVLGLPLVTLRDRRALGRVLCWGMAAIAFFFCVRSGGDWMKGYRWMNFVVIPATLLFTMGVDELASLAQRLLGRARGPGWSTPGWLVATGLTIALMPGFFTHSDFFFGKRETGPFSVQKRADYTEWLMERLWVQDRLVRNLDVDMGAHLYWSSHQMVDMAGLVDYTIAHHDYKQRAVTQEYVFKEAKPLVAHVHGGWANTSRIPTFAEWKRDYVLVPGFPVSTRTNHMGNHVRRDLMMSETWEGQGGRQVPFEDGITLAGFNVPSPSISQGKALYVEVGLQYRKIDDKENFRTIGFLSNAEGELHAFDVPVGYDWLPPEEWRIGEVNTVRIAPPTPDELPPGLYDLGFVFVGADGRRIDVARLESDPERYVELPEGVVIGGVGEEPARFAVGEVRFPSVVRIGPPGTGERAALDDFARAMLLANAGDCAEAEAQWRLARLHLPRASAWQDEHGATFRAAEATCYAELAAAQADPADAVAFLEAARVWNHRDDRHWEVAREVGDTLMHTGLAAFEDGQWTQAYEALDGAVRANPTLSWARRAAEEARDKRLGIDADTVAAEKAARDAELEEHRARRALEAKVEEPDEAAPEGPEAEEEE